MRRSPDTPNALFALYQQWRKHKPWLGNVLQAVWRPAVEDAAAAFERWTETNTVHGNAVVDAEKKGKNIPRRVQRRVPDPKKLFVSRKQRDREHKHVVRIADRVKLLDAKTLRVPGIGDIPLKERMPENTDVRAVTLRERTPAAKRGNLGPGERIWTAHISCRNERPLKPLPVSEKIKSAGCDHGVVHALTVSDQDGNVTHLHYPEAKPNSERSWRRLECLKVKCKRGSRRWRKLQSRQNRHTRHERNRRQEARRCWANTLARGFDIVGIELLEIRNMMRSARGTNEAHGKRVAQKRGLARRLAATAPGLQTVETVRACERAATRYVLVPARGTSRRCAKCSHAAKENRESQAVFRCKSCGHTANADANAAENDRQHALAFHGVAVERPRGSTPKSLRHGACAVTPDRRDGEDSQSPNRSRWPALKRHGPGDTTEAMTCT